MIYDLELRLYRLEGGTPITGSLKKVDDYFYGEMEVYHKRYWEAVQAGDTIDTMAEIPEHLVDKEDSAGEPVNMLRTRPQKVKPVNHFLEETAKPTPAMTKKPSVPASKFEAGDLVRHVSFGLGTVLSVRPMGADTLYEIVFDRVGTKKLMATYAKLKKV